MDKYSPDKEFVVMDRDQVRAFDAWAINTLSIPGAVLMENAGKSCAELIMEKLTAIKKPKVCIFCGTGNNGGDGYVIARHMMNNNFNVNVIICGRAEKIKGDAKINLDILKNMSLQIEQLELNNQEMVKSFADGADMIVDALFGTGLKGRLKNE